MQTIHRTPQKDFFTVLPNALLRDSRLSYKARGVLAMALSCTDGWRIDNKWLEEQGTEGRESIAAAMSEAEAAGYAVYAEHRERGRIVGGAWQFFDVPVAESKRTNKTKWRDGNPTVIRQAVTRQPRETGSRITVLPPPTEEDQPEPAHRDTGSRGTESRMTAPDDRDTGSRSTVNTPENTTPTEKNDETHRDTANRDTATRVRTEETSTEETTEGRGGTPRRKKEPAAVSEEGLRFAEWFLTLLPEAMRGRQVGEWRRRWAGAYDALAKFHTKEEIAAVCRFCRANTYFASVVQSPLKLLETKRGTTMRWMDIILAESKGAAPARQQRQSAVQTREINPDEAFGKL